MGRKKKYGKKPKKPKKNRRETMSLTAVVTKAWPTYHPSNGLFFVGVNVVLNDDDTTYRHLPQAEQKNADFFVAAHKGADPEDKAAELLSKVQSWIDAYKDEKVAHKHAKYENMTDAVEAGLDLTE